MSRILLPVIVFAQFAGTSLWFAGNALLADVGALSPAAITASVQVGFILGTLVFSLFGLADRVAAKLLFLTAACCGAAANALMPFFIGEPTVVLILRAVTGFFLAGIYPVGMKITAELFPDKAPRAMGWLVGALVLGTAFPHLLKGGLRELPITIVSGLVSLLALMGGLLVFFLVPEKRTLRHQRFNPGALASLWHHKPFRHAALGYLGHMWELYTFWASVPLLLRAQQPETNTPIGFTAFAVIGTGTLGCIMGGFLAYRYGSRRVAALSLAGSGACCMLLPVMLTASPAYFFAYLLVWGFLVVADSPQLTTLAAQTAPPERKGTALTLLTCAGFLLTVFSLLFIQYLAAGLAQPVLSLVALAPGPALGFWALRKRHFLKTTNKA